jgi:hypothetical protein
MKIKLTETQVHEIINSGEIDESIFDSIRNTYQGVRGFFKGQGYNYFKHISELKNYVKDLKRLDAPNHKIMVRLAMLENKIMTSNMEDSKKTELSNKLKEVIKHFNDYSSGIDGIESMLLQKLN